MCSSAIAASPWLKSNKMEKDVKWSHMQRAVMCDDDDDDDDDSDADPSLEGDEDMMVLMNSQ